MNHHISGALVRARNEDARRRRAFATPHVRENPRPVGPDTLSLSPW
jgi:hypothetical protein